MWLFPAEPATAAFAPVANRVSSHSEMITSLGFSSDGAWLASGSIDGSLNLWRASDGRLWRNLKVQEGEAAILAFSPVTNRMASAGGKRFVVWEAPSGKIVATSTNRLGKMTALCVSPDGKTLASGSSYNSISFWAMSDGSPRKTWKAHNWDVTSLAFSPDGKLLASSDYDGSIRLWNPEDNSLRRSEKAHARAIFCIQFSPDGRYLASAGLDDEIRLWTMPALRRCGNVRANSRRVYSLAFSPNGRILASGGWDKSVKLWSVPGLTLQANFTAHQGRVHALAFAPDGLTLASGSSDRRVRLWQVATRNLIYSLGD